MQLLYESLLNMEKEIEIPKAEKTKTLNENNLEIKSLDSEIASLTAQIGEHQQKIDALQILISQKQKQKEQILQGKQSKKKTKTKE